MVARLASDVKDEEALYFLFNGPIVSNERYNLCLPLIGFCIEFLEISSVAVKAQILHWLELVSVGDGAFKEKPFDKRKYIGKGEMDYTEYYDMVEKGCPVYLSFLFQDTPDKLRENEVLKAIALLSVFPNFKEDSIPVLEELYHNQSKAVAIRVSAILAISHLELAAQNYLNPYEKEDDDNKTKETNEIKKEKLETEQVRKLRESLLRTCTQQAPIFSSLSISSKIICTWEVTCLLMLFDNQEIPKPAKDLVVQIITDIELNENIEKETTHIQRLLLAALNKFCVQFCDELITCLASPTVPYAVQVIIAGMLAAAMLQGRSDGYRAYGYDPPDDYVTPGLNDKQAEAIHAIASCDKIWTDQRDLPFLITLHSNLTKEFPPSREALQKGLQRRLEQIKNNQYDYNYVRKEYQGSFSRRGGGGFGGGLAEEDSKCKRGQEGEAAAVPQETVRGGFRGRGGFEGRGGRGFDGRGRFQERGRFGGGRDSGFEERGRTFKATNNSKEEQNTGIEPTQGGFRGRGRGFEGRGRGGRGGFGSGFGGFEGGERGKFFEGSDRKEQTTEIEASQEKFVASRGGLGLRGRGVFRERGCFEGRGGRGRGRGSRGGHNEGNSNSEPTQEFGCRSGIEGEESNSNSEEEFTEIEPTQQARGGRGGTFGGRGGIRGGFEGRGVFGDRGVFRGIGFRGVSGGRGGFGTPEQIKSQGRGGFGERGGFGGVSFEGQEEVNNNIEKEQTEDADLHKEVEADLKGFRGRGGFERGGRARARGDRGRGVRGGFEGRGGFRGGRGGLGDRNEDRDSHEEDRGRE